MNPHLEQELNNIPNKIARVKRLGRRLLQLFVVLLLSFLILDKVVPLPIEEFEQRHFAQVVVDRSGQPLRSFADAKGIWRYPVALDEVSPRYIEALLGYEDRYFYQHFGVNPLAVIRALGQRVSEGRFVSGASTLTMQVARILKPHDKTLLGKATQMFRALQLEWHYSKEEILTFYLNYAPFGGPIEGVQAASYVYLGKPASELSYSEAALLAVLPQAPSRYRPDRHPQKARKARDKVLQRMSEQKTWSEQVIKEASEEPLWVTYNSRPMMAPLLTRRLSQRYADQALIQSTIDIQLQANLENLLKDHISRKPEQVSAAIVVVNNEDMSTLAYLGSADFLSATRQGSVDMVTAIRSPGSTLKPFIYGMAIDDGLIHSQSLLFDVPQSFSGYRPQNFTDDFSGPVSVTQALTRSLNMPAVQVMDKLTPESFYVNLKNAGLNIHLPNQAKPNLSLALGGGGVSMEELVGVFSSLGNEGQAGRIRLAQNEPIDFSPLMSSGAAWIVQDALSQASLKNHINRRHLVKSPGIAFKTGTSYGFRDAWVLASNDLITIAVWVGQPDGSYLAENSGRNSAVPLLNQVLAAIPADWHQVIEKPFTVDEKTICWPLGVQLKSQNKSDCQQQRAAQLLEGMSPPTFSDPLNELFATEHKTMLLDTETGLRVTPQCALGATEVDRKAVWPLVLENWLPEHLKRKNTLPAFHPNCLLTETSNTLNITGIHDQAVIYPEVSANSIPDVELQLHGSSGRNYWFLNGQLLDQSSSEVVLKNLTPGQYDLNVIDSSGKTAELSFAVNI